MTKKSMKTIFGIVMAIAMVLSLSVCAFAEEAAATDAQKISAENLKINKVVKYPDGASVDSDTKFTFTFAAVDGYTNPSTDVPDDVTATVKSSDMNGTAGAGKHNEVSIASGAIDLSKLTSYGTYKFKVSEKSVDPDTGWTTAENTYTMQVFVQADGTQTVTVINDSTGKKIDNTDEDKDGSVDDFKFENTYKENGGNNGGGNEDGDETKDSLVISKTLAEGSSGKSDDTFKFKVEFTQSDLDKSGATTYSYNVVTANGNVKKTISVSGGEIELKAGEKAVFNDIPAGTYYTVTESSMPSGYELNSTTVVANGTSTETSPYLIGEKANSAAFENKTVDNPVTGILQNGAPYFLIFGAAVLMILLYLAAARKRRNAED